MVIDATKSSLYQPERLQEFGRARPMGTDQIRLGDFLPEELATALRAVL